ncbi:hypothetical protein EOD42_22405 [Rhodovarius crocodyli]|uniref:Uncharacterized protein n=1 Tax=Rhodovarius crocodyli TaxID=1979269 RepID=A0A437M118_9PROT|nr:hypothetical protein [Rhodovarius crocodyli]RVT91410.1 hypothetical protein EOD42_22405 [Rhodovarius crocodyli]
MMMIRLAAALAVIGMAAGSQNAGAQPASTASARPAAPASIWFSASENLDRCVRSTSPAEALMALRRRGRDDAWIDDRPVASDRERVMVGWGTSDYMGLMIWRNQGACEAELRASQRIPDRYR